MEAFLVSSIAVAAAELGDKTQLVALCLASQFRKPAPILLGILAATLLSHAAAGVLGQWMGELLHGGLLHGLLALSFAAAAVWAFIPDRLDCEPMSRSHHGIFLTAFFTFFLAEIGDKTQLATAALAAQFQSLAAVVAGTVLGMMAVNVPSVLFSHAVTARLSLKAIRIVSGLIFLCLGTAELHKLFA